MLDGKQCDRPFITEDPHMQSEWGQFLSICRTGLFFFSSNQIFYNRRSESFKNYTGHAFSSAQGVAEPVQMYALQDIVQ